MSAFSERIEAEHEGHRIELVAKTHVVRGILYELSIDGELRNTTRNWLKRPGRFVVETTLTAGDDSMHVVGSIRQGLLSSSLALSVDGRELTASDASTSDRGARTRRIAVVGALAIFATTVALFSVLSVLPTRSAPVAEQHAPFAMRDGRKPVTCNSLATRRGCDPQVVKSAVGEAVEIPSLHPERGLSALSGTLTLPDGPSPPHPAVVLVGGSGGHPRDPEMRGGLVVHHEPFKLYGKLVDLFVGMGIAVLAYDKRTCRTCYEGYTPDLPSFRFSYFADDARSALAFLRERDDIAGNALVLVGHSQGGGIVARLAGEERGIAATIMLAGSTNGFGEAMSAQLRRVAELRSGQWDLLGAAWFNWQASDFEECLATAQQTPDEPSKCLHGVTARAFEAEAARAATTEPTVTAMKTPILALQGQLDRNIDPAVIHRLRDILEERDAEVHLIAGVGHTLVHRDDIDAPVLDATTEKILSDFLRSVPHPGL